MNYRRKAGATRDGCYFLRLHRANFRWCGAVPCPVSRFCHFWSVTSLFLSPLTAKMLCFVDGQGEESSGDGVLAHEPMCCTTGNGMNHDQNFKNLILDYPRQALEFFAAAEAGALAWETARITPVRQEQVQERLGERFRELDTPLLVEWPGGKRAALLFVVEEETQPGRFSIHRLAHYCLDLAELLDTERVVPVVIFLRSGAHPDELRLGGEQQVYLRFHYLACDLSRLPATQYLNSANLVARLNLVNMAYAPEQRLEVYARAQDGLAGLESNWDQRLKYADFIDGYAQLSEIEWAQYRREYLADSDQREVIMGMLSYSRKEGLQQGLQQGEALLLRRLLMRRFGPLPERVRLQVS